MQSSTLTSVSYHGYLGGGARRAAKNGNQDRGQRLHMRTRQEETAKAESRRDRGLLRLLIPPLATTILTLSSPNLLSSHPSASMAAGASPGGAALFRKACIGCHDAGGNILQPGASLFTADLERNGVATEEEIYKITYFGKARMPGFGEKCTPRGQCTFGPRLQEEEIRQLAEFVKLQAANGWPKMELQGEDQ